MLDFKSIKDEARYRPDKFTKITIIDHSCSSEETEEQDTPEASLFCSSCKVDDPQLNGSLSYGGYITYLCTLVLLDGTIHSIRKRYSECLSFRAQIVMEKPDVYIPHLPPKSYTQKTKRSFVESRRAGIELFLRSVVLNPEIGNLPVVSEWFAVAGGARNS